MPMPSANTVDAPPTSVVTRPPAIARIRLFVPSDTYTVAPDADTATACGALKSAHEATPSAVVSAPKPASVVMTPLGEIERMR